jgi:transcriptional regulator with XRE-family HTH domain
MSGPDRQLKSEEQGSGPIDELVGAGLRQRREERGLSVSELSRAAGVSEGDIRCWETGKVRIPAHTLLLLIEALQLDPPWFFESLHDMELRRHQTSNAAKS